MKEKVFALFGIFGPLFAYISIAASIMLSPWFSWQNNALSDLGHSVQSNVAPIYNWGLLLAGLFMIIYAITTFRNYAKYTSLSLVISAFLLQLVATFDEVYGRLHGVVSVLFFISIGIVSVVYTLEKKSLLSLILFIIGLFSWILYGMKIYQTGVAVPETISSVAVSFLLVSSAIRKCLSK